MSVVRFLSAAIIAAWALPAAAAPLEAYGRLPSIETVAVSPSGKAVALVITDGEARGIVVEGLETGQVSMRAGLGSAKVRLVRWAGDGHLIVVTSMTASPIGVITSQREWLMGFSLDVATRKTKLLLKDVPEAMNILADVPVVRNTPAGPVVLVEGVKFEGGDGRLTLFRVDPSRGTGKIVEIGGPDTRDWVIGADGDPVAQELYNAKSGLWTLRVKTGAGWRDAVAVTRPLDAPSMMGLGQDGRSVLYTTSDDKGHAFWREARLDNAPEGAPLLVSDRQSPIRDPQDGRLIGSFALTGDDGRYSFFNPADTKIWSAVIAAFPGSAVQLVSWSLDRRKIAVRVDSPTEGPAYALVDLSTREARWLGAEYAGVKPVDVAPTKAIRFKAADGLDLSGYLTLPRDRPAKALPLIVFPHGGPAARDEPGFDWWTQAMASRGYAVLRVNFRGSDGFGDPLLTAGYGQWGRKMQTDLSDGVRTLAAEGTIDPARVCIVGASYGGYAAMAGAALDTGVYRCAVSYGGISDLGRFVDWVRDRKGAPPFRYLLRFVGAENGRDGVLDAVSPADHADKVNIPILLLHGRDDSVVPLEQSKIMADALAKAGKPVELVVYKGEDHWLSRGETRLQTLQATMAFVEKYNPPN